MWRCINKPIGYCDGEPEWEIEPSIIEKDVGAGSAFGGVCRLDYHSCGKFKRLDEVIDSSKVLEPSYRHTTTLKSKEEKPKKVDKPEKETPQMELF